ncbi:hypothetical protein RRG08_015203 [Elysia crispata]|uniref:Uncharacterized protein n=1 Tax=Elysia crispata TaxID=231223 RepID=A0AAE1A7V9_9GAST|nr:hypothetical protein RRG08_015203 [Elysia crispata]
MSGLSLCFVVVLILLKLPCAQGRLPSATTDRETTVDTAIITTPPERETTAEPAIITPPPERETTVETTPPDRETDYASMTNIVFMTTPSANQNNADAMTTTGAEFSLMTQSNNAASSSSSNSSICATHDTEPPPKYTEKLLKVIGYPLGALLGLSFLIAVTLIIGRRYGAILKRDSTPLTDCEVGDLSASSTGSRAVTNPTFSLNEAEGGKEKGNDDIMIADPK